MRNRKPVIHGGKIALFWILNINLLTGCTLPTVSSLQADSKVPCSSVEQMAGNQAYVWTNADGGSLEEDLNRDAGRDVFYPCILGQYNFKRQEMSAFSEHPRTIWIDSTLDGQIPTVTGNSRLLYHSESEVPSEFVFERFADYGYTIGIANLVSDGGGHYYIPYASLNKDDYKYYVDQASDASQILVFGIIEKLYLDRVGDLHVEPATVSDGGTVLDLAKDTDYVCEFYTGTYYQDFTLKSSIHTFGSMERFVSYEYEFLHSNCIEVAVPEYLKSGYYLINGTGLFRYVASEDEELYDSGRGSDAVDWNDPVIQYDEYGTVLYDPSVSMPEETSEEPEPVDADLETLPEDDGSDPGIDAFEDYRPPVRKGAKS